MFEKCNLIFFSSSLPHSEDTCRYNIRGTIKGTRGFEATLFEDIKIELFEGEFYNLLAYPMIDIGIKLQLLTHQFYWDS